MQWFKVPGKIFFEAGSVQYLAKMPNITRALIVADPMMVKLGYVDRVIYQLNKNASGVSYEIFSEVEPDPDLETVKKGTEAMNSFKPDVIIALGGGSAAPAGRGFQIGHRQTMLGHHGLDLGDHAGALRGAEFLDGAGNFFLLLAQFFLLGAQVLESRHGRGIPRRSSTCSARSMPELPAGTEIFQA